MSGGLPQPHLGSRDVKAYALDLLAGVDRASVLEHLAACDRCGKALDTMLADLGGPDVSGLR